MRWTLKMQLNIYTVELVTKVKRRFAATFVASSSRYLHSVAYNTASPKVMKIFSPPQTRNQSQVVQNDKLSRENVKTKIFVGGNDTFFHFLEKKLKKIWEKISKKKFFLLQFVFLS